MNRICGRVLDPGQQVVAHASVRIYLRDSSPHATAETDERGEFCFNAIPRGDYLLQAEANSMVLTQPKPVSVGPNMSRLPDLSLAIVPMATQVTVTSSGSPQSAQETTKSLDVINISEALARGQDSLVQAVRNVPGVRVTQRGGPGSFSTIQIRGLRTFDTSILIDGMRFRDPAATQADGSAFLSDLWFTDTSRVEVLRGAGASLYGTNAIGGVINLLTDQGSSPLHGDIDLQGGGLGQLLGRGHLSGGARDGRLFYSMGFGHVNVTEGLDGDDRYRNTGGLASIDYAFTPKLRMGFRILSADVFGQLNTNPSSVPDTLNLPARGSVTAVPLKSSQIPAALSYTPYVNGNATFIPSVNDPDYYRTAQFTSTMVFVQHDLTPTLSYHIGFSDLHTYRSYVNGPSGPGIFQPTDRTSDKYNGHINTVQVRTDWQPVRSQLVSAGYEFEREGFVNPSYTGQVPALVSKTTITQSSNAAFFQDQAKLLSDRLQVSVSGRWQGFTVSTPAFSGLFPVYSGASALKLPGAFTGDASTAYFFRRSNTKLRGHVGNAYRAPSLYERFGTSFYGDVYTAYGDPRLRPERAISLDGGFDQYLFGDKARVSATYFYTRLQQTIDFDFSGLISPATDPFGRFLGYYNTRGGIARGVELSGETKLAGRLVLRGSYTYTKSLDRVSQFGDGTLQTPRIYPHLFTFDAARQFGRNWDASFTFIAGSHYLFPFDGLPNVFPGPRQADVSVGYTKPVGERSKARIYTSLDNITNHRIYQDGFLTPGLVARGGVQIFF